MSKSIVDEAKKEVSDKKAKDKKPMVVEVKKLIINTIIIVALLSLGAFIGIKSNNAVDTYIDQRVQSQLKIEQ